MSQRRDRKPNCCDLTALSLCGAPFCRADRKQRHRWPSLLSDAINQGPAQIRGKCLVKNAFRGRLVPPKSPCTTQSQVAPGGRINACSNAVSPTVTPYHKVSGAEDVVDFERLVDLGEPLGPVGCAAAAALVERQFQLAQQAGDLLARRHVPQAGTGAKCCFVEVVKRGQAARKKLAVNHAFGETINRAEAKPER